MRNIEKYQSTMEFVRTILRGCEIRYFVESRKSATERRTVCNTCSQNGMSLSPLPIHGSAHSPFFLEAHDAKLLHPRRNASRINWPGERAGEWKHMERCGEYRQKGGDRLLN
jgi:hypothetical protein